MNPKSKPKTMNNLILILTLCLTMLFAGCSTIDNPNQLPAPSGAVVKVWEPTSSDLDRIQTLATMGTGAGLQFGITDPAKRTETANQIYLLASGAWQLTNGVVPTSGELKSYVLTFDGSEKTAEYVSMATSLSAIYGTYYPKLSGNPKSAAQVINTLAQGAKLGADAYRTK